MLQIDFDAEEAETDAGSFPGGTVVPRSILENPSKDATGMSQITD